jgi:hypothetical protein
MSNFACSLGFHATKVTTGAAVSAIAAPQSETKDTIGMVPNAVYAGNRPRMKRLDF